MKKLGRKEQDKETVKQDETKPAGKRTGFYMICVLIFLVLLVGVAFIINKKVKAPEGNANAGDNPIEEGNAVAEDVSLTVYGEMSQEELLVNMKESVVRIEADIPDMPESSAKMVGSGVIIKITDSYIDIATASHVVESTANPLVYFYDGSLAYGSVLAYGKQNDVAFVRVEATALSEGIGDELQAAKCGDNEDYEALQTEEAVYMIGSVSEVAGSIEHGIIKEKERFVELFQNDMLVCETSVSGGMSGGGIFYWDGKLIGIIVGTDDVDTVSIAITDVMAEYRSILL